MIHSITASYIFTLLPVLLKFLLRGKFKREVFVKLLSSHFSSAFPRFLLMLFGGSTLLDRLLAYKRSDHEEPIEKASLSITKRKIVSASISSSLAFLLLPSNLRVEMTLFAIVRSIDTFVTANQSQIASVVSPIFLSLTSTLLFQLSTWQIMYSWFYHPNALPSSYRMWISRLAKMDPRILETLKDIKEETVLYNATSALPPKLLNFVQDLGMKDAQNWRGPLPCQMAHGGEIAGCIDHTISTFKSGFFDAMKIYVPLNAFFLLFRLKAKRKRMMKTVYNAGYATIKSSTFLGLFIAIIWAVICLGRNTFNRHDRPSGPVLGTFICGFSVMLENHARRRQLALYTLPKAIESFVSTHMGANSIALQSIILPLQMVLFSTSTTYMMHEYAKNKAHVSPLIQSIFKLFMAT